MGTNLVYFDETGDDGLIKTSSETFILTSIYMKSEDWQKNYNQIKFLRKQLKDKYGLYNPIQSKYSYTFKNQPISGLIEDILEKDSEESYFIQICDFISYFVHLYYKCCVKKNDLPNRVTNVIDKKFVGSVMATLKKSNTLNLNANKSNRYGLVIYPK